MKLSVCLIVKNEERVLARSLSCASKIADELIVVDTGSTDRSVEIAKQFTDKVYLHPWQGSFAEARNYAYSLATCDYMMWLDADDVIDDENIERFRKLKKDTGEDTDVIFTIYRDYTEDGIGMYILRDRIIKRTLNPKWVGDVHEAIPIVPAWNRKYACDITIIHKKEYVNDPGRNMGIYGKNFRDGKALNLFEKCNYVKELVLAEQYTEALDAFQELKGEHLPAGVYHYAMFFIVDALLKLGQYEDCIREIEEMGRKMPITAHLAYFEGVCYERLKKRDAAKQCYHRAMTIPDDPTNLYLQYAGFADYFPLLRLAEMTAIDGDCGKALEYIKEASELYPLNDAWKKTRISVLLLAARNKT